MKHEEGHNCIRHRPTFGHRFQGPVPNLETIRTVELYSNLSDIQPHRVEPDVLHIVQEEAKPTTDL